MIELLKKEGHNVRQVGSTQRYRLMDYTDTHYNINNMKISVLQTDEQIIEAFQKARGEQE